MGRRNVTFWTADPYYRLHPEVANPGALSARLLENPTEGPNFSDISSILFAVRSSALADRGRAIEKKLFNINVAHRTLFALEQRTLKLLDKSFDSKRKTLTDLR